MIISQEIPCPKCGGKLRWVQRGVRAAGYCACNPPGPVVEINIDTYDDTDNDAPLPAIIGAELFELPDISVEIVGALVNRGYTTLAQVQAASDDALLAISGIGPARLAKIRGYAPIDT
mgnify:CR=1 FL=1